MKKSISILAVAALATSMFVACGPSKAELEAKAKLVADSTAEVAKADSIAKVEEAAKMAAAETAKADSLAQVAKADSLAKAEEASKGKKGKK